MDRGGGVEQPAELLQGSVHDGAQLGGGLATSLARHGPDASGVSSGCNGPASRSIGHARRGHPRRRVQQMLTFRTLQARGQCGQGLCSGCRKLWNVCYLDCTNGHELIDCKDRRRCVQREQAAKLDDGKLIACRLCKCRSSRHGRPEEGQQQPYDLGNKHEVKAGQSQGDYYKTIAYPIFFFLSHNLSRDDVRGEKPCNSCCRFIYISSFFSVDLS